MRYQTLLTAISEAERFLQKAKELLALDSEVRSVQKDLAKSGYVETSWQNKQTASVKRSSMDLTRALAEMRKP